MQTLASELEMKLKIQSKDVGMMVDDRMKRLDDIPDSTQLVKKSEFSRFKQNFENYRDNVDRLTDVLLKGYKNDADHTLKSKVSKTEVEDLMFMKFDHERGKELERENRDQEK